jgi:hypothetical protein
MLNFIKKRKNMTIATLAIITVFIGFLLQTKIVFAGGGEGCSSVGQCINDLRCTAANVSSSSGPSGGACGGTAIIGEVAPPDAISGLVNKGAAGSNAIVFFISRIINFGTIIAGLITIGNFIAAGVMYVSAGSTGDTGVHTKVRDKLTYGIVGLLIIVVSYTIVGLVGLIFFGDPLFTLNPSLSGL